MQLLSSSIVPCATCEHPSRGVMDKPCVRTVGRWLGATESVLGSLKRDADVLAAVCQLMCESVRVGQIAVELPLQSALKYVEYVKTKRLLGPPRGKHKGSLATSARWCKLRRCCACTVLQCAPSSSSDYSVARFVQA
eukprot:6214015-Pleurochrysis_carterae.AAC.2